MPRSARFPGVSKPRSVTAATRALFAEIDGIVIVRHRIQVKFVGKWVNHAAHSFATHELAEIFAIANVKPGLWRIVEVR